MRFAIAVPQFYSDGEFDPVAFGAYFRRVEELGFDSAWTQEPFQKPFPPVWFGANGPVALRRAVRAGDGFFGAGSAPAARFADQVGAVRQALAESDRPDREFPIAKRVYIAIGTDAGRARTRINDELERIYGRRSADVEAAAIAGTPADCVRELRLVADAGAELILFTPLFEQAEQAEQLAALVIPQL